MGRVNAIVTQESDRHPLRVLVADDDRAITTVLGSTLKNWRISCMAAHDGASALDLTLKFQPDVLVLDVSMPSLDGFSVLRLLKQQKSTRHIKILLLTASDEARHIVRAFRLGADDYVIKPFVTVDVAARIKALGIKRR